MNENLSPKAKRDYLLVKRALEGEQQAFAKLLSLYKDTIFFMMLKMINNPDDAEDLTIEAFGKAFHQLHKYSGEYAFSTWLFKIAANNCIDYLRKKRMQTFSINQNFEDDEGNNQEFNLPSGEADPEERFIIKQKKTQLRSLVNQLKPKYKKLIELRYFEELSYEEIAVEMNLPLGTVKAQLFRAKELLLNIIKRSNDTIP